MNNHTSSPARGAAPPRGHRRGLRVSASVAALLLAATGITAAQAATEVTEKNLSKLTAVGPVNTEHGFPSWYQDNTGLRLELCLDGANPLCNFPAGEIPDETAPISFPDNFPEESFYMLGEAEIDLEGGGTAVLVLGLEAAFANTVANGDQVVFGRQRITVKGAAPDTTLTFQHPYGTMTIDTDDSGRGRLVEDISPAAGNFTTALKSNIGPFLKWDPDVSPAAPEGYIGDPSVPHKVVGSPFGRNSFSAQTADGTRIGFTDEFAINGKISTNRGVQADRAVLTTDADGKRFIDVFASSEGTQLQVAAGAGIEVTPLRADQLPEAVDPANSVPMRRFYARIALTGDAPAEIRVQNIGDKPISASTVKVAKPSGIAVVKAAYDGTELAVAARSDFGGPVTAEGYGALELNPASGLYEGTFPSVAPPATAVVNGPQGAGSLPVSITGGAASTGQDPVTPSPDPGPVIEVGEPGTGEPGTGEPGDGGEPPAIVVAADAATAATGIAPGSIVGLDGSASTGAASYAWRQLSGSPATITGANTVKPTVALPLFAATTDTAPRKVTPAEPVVIELTVTGADGAVATDTVSLPVQADRISIDSGSRHRLGTEFRVTGTSSLTGVLTPGTSVIVYDTTPGRPVTKLGTAAVDTTGAFTLKQKPGPSRSISSVLVQSTRGGEARATVSNR